MNAAKNRFVDELARRNRQSCELWEEYACHRRHVMELLAAAADQLRPRRLCALGAGNCNDLDLPKLLRSYNEIHLVDVDSAAVEAAVARQGAAGPRVRIHGRMDVTGCLHSLIRDLSTNGIENGQLDGWIEKIRTLAPFPQPSPFCVVVSLGLVTQLAEIAFSLVGGPDHPRGNDLLFALRNHHLRKILEMTRPGGVAVLITDVVSSATMPELEALDERVLPREMYRQVAAKNFFTGANPYALEAMFRNDADLASRVSEVEMLDPWRWQQGPRTLLVSGLRLRTNG